MIPASISRRSARVDMIDTPRPLSTASLTAVMLPNSAVMWWVPKPSACFVEMAFSIARRVPEPGSRRTIGSSRSSSSVMVRRSDHRWSDGTATTSSSRQSVVARRFGSSSPELMTPISSSPLATFVAMPSLPGDPHPNPDVGVGGLERRQMRRQQVLAGNRAGADHEIATPNPEQIGEIVGHALVVPPAGVLRPRTIVDRPRSATHFASNGAVAPHRSSVPAWRCAPTPKPAPGGLSRPPA